MGSADSQRLNSQRIGPSAGGPEDSDRLSEPREENRIERWLERSSPFTLSLSLHVIILVVLALLITRAPTPVRMRIDLMFGTEQGVGPAAEGVAIEQELPGDEEPEGAEPEPEAEPEREVAVMSQPSDSSAVDESQLTQAIESMEDTPVSEKPAAAPSIRFALAGRSAGRRETLLHAGGGGGETETAVALALEWLVRHQEKGGLWSLRGPYLDGSRQENRLAATAMALLALQGAGNTTREGLHRDAVRAAWKALLPRQSPNGAFDLGAVPDSHAMYAHAQVTIALCELVAMTDDEEMRQPARRALEYAIAAQMPDGGWRYHPPEPNRDDKGDMSVTGWYMMALKSGEMAGFTVPSETYERLERFLEAVFVSNEKGYGYQIMPTQRFFQIRPALTAEALLCRQYLGWQRDDPRLVAGIDLLVREVPKNFDYPNVYAWYYTTQVLHHAGGEPWRRWNDWMRVSLPAAQVTKGRERGSWNPANDTWGYSGGRLFMTCLSACMLEVYYRHLPLQAASDE